MELMTVIKERKSVRTFLKDPIPDALIREVLEAASLAPSWANTQVWRFIIVKDGETKRRLAETLTAKNPCRQAIVDAPVTICLAALRGASGIYKGVPATDKGDWFMYDAGIAMEHVVLAAWNLGLGTCHVGAFDARKAEEILCVPEGYSIVSLTPVGHFITTPQKTPRKALKEIAYLDNFGKPYLA
jgi:nitroreductase